MNRNRPKQLTFFVTEKERNIIDSRYKQFGFSDRSSFIRKSVLETNIINVNLDELSIISKELNRIGININQIAKKANTNSDDIFDDSSLKLIQKDFSEIVAETKKAFRHALKIDTSERG